MLSYVLHTQGSSEHDYLVCIDIVAAAEVVESSLSVQVQSLLGRRTIRVAIAAIFQQADIASQLVDEAFDIDEPMTNVPGIAVQKEDCHGFGESVRGLLDEEQMNPSPVATPAVNWNRQYQ